MKEARIPKEVLAAEIRAGRVTVKGMGGSRVTGAVGRAADAIAAAGLRKAADVLQAGQGLRFPPYCCNCLSEGRQVRPVASTSVVNRGVAYLFRFAIPHCAACGATANRTRPGMMGLLAAFLGVSVPVGIAMVAAGAATNRDALISASFIVAPLVGLALPYVWMKTRRPRRGQASHYQAVYVSQLDIDFSGVPTSFTLMFENAMYASRFVALNRDAGIMEV